MAFTILGTQNPAAQDNFERGLGQVVNALNDATTGFVAADITAGNVACAIATTANTACKPTASSKLFGKVLAINPDLTLLVQCKGVMRLHYTSTAPTLGKSVICTTDGTVIAGTSDATINNGIVVAVITGGTDATNYVDVLL